MRILLAIDDSACSVGHVSTARSTRGVGGAELAGHDWGAVTVSHLEGSHEGERVRRGCDAGS